MKQNFKKCLMVMGATVLLSSCAGYNRILFLTKTNVGIDVSREPLPTAEVTIARREVGISPTYQDTISGHDKTLPLFGVFSLSDGLFNPNISSVFAGGAAAVAIASGSQENGDSLCNQKDKKEDCKQENGKNTCKQESNDSCDSIMLSEYPDDRGWFERFWRPNPTEEEKKEKTKGQVKPFYFATDTSYGVKVAWDGTGGPYPTSLKIGYNRTEFAYPPILISQNNNQYEVKVPTFFASVQNKSRFGQILTDKKTGVSQAQVFATGKAAHEWAKRTEVRKATFNMIFPPEVTEAEKPANLVEAKKSEDSSDKVSGK